MIPILYKTITPGTVPSDYGVGVLTDCLGAEVTEERNGQYELVLTYAASGIHAEEITVLSYIKTSVNFTDDPQLFEVYKVGKVLNGKFTVNAKHISYDLSGKLIVSGTASSCAAACALLEAQASPFTIRTDKTTVGTFKITEPSSVRSWFGGKEGSLLDVYGTGEWKYDNFSAFLYLHRGADRNVTIRNGKNLTELSQEMDIENLATGVMPFYKDQDGNVTAGAIVPTGLTLNYEKNIAVDFSQDVDPESDTPILTQLATLGARYVANNNLTVPTNSITIGIAQIGELSERIDLCDTVKIYYEALGITATADCVAITWDCLQERYVKATFGSAKTNITDTFSQAVKQLADTASKSYTAQAVARATDLISGNLGGYVINGHDSNGDGYPDENLIMDTPDINTARKVIRENLGGIGLSTTGYAGPFQTAITAEGIVADAITTGILNANLIKAGVISDTQGNSTIDMTSGQANLHNLKARNGLYLVDDNGNIRGYFKEEGVGESHLSLVDSQNKPLAQMFIASANGGVITVDNVNHKEMARLSAENGGILRIMNSQGTTVAYLWSPSGNKDGSLILNDSSGTNNISAYGGDGSITCVSLRQTSSRKLKKNIKPIEDAAKILELDAVSFDYINEARGINKRGFIAEDIAEILPNLVTEETDTTPATVDYISMIPYLQTIIKSQEARISVLEQQINTVEDNTDGD